MSVTITTPYGRVGLRQFGGFIQEEFLPKLQGQRGIAIYRQMLDNSPMHGAIMCVWKNLMESPAASFAPADDTPEAKRYADFFESMRGDMASTWGTIFSEILDCIPYGFKPMEILLKVRRGESEDPTLRSRYNDGLYAWRDWSPRAPETIYRWIPSDQGDIVGFQQMCLPDYSPRTVPLDACANFMLSTRKNNPEGYSLFRPTYRPVYRMWKHEDILDIGAERQIAGMPISTLPTRCFSKNASPDDKQSLADTIDMLEKVRFGQYNGLALPAEQDQGGKPTGYSFKLAAPDGRDRASSIQIISALQGEILTVLMCQFLKLGQEGRGGSRALADNNTDLLSLAINAALGSIDDTINLHCSPIVMRANRWPMAMMPRHTHGDIEAPDLGRIGQFLTAAVTSGTLVPDRAINAAVRTALMSALKEYATTSEEDEEGVPGAQDAEAIQAEATALESTRARRVQEVVTQGGVK